LGQEGRRMTIVEVMEKILEASLKGAKLNHYFERGQDGKQVCVLYSTYPFPYLIFRHKPDNACESIPVTVSMSQAIEIVKEYWDRRIEKHDH
jgi:hypothetical protein